jgi:hypothetical protein
MIKSRRAGKLVNDMAAFARTTISFSKLTPVHVDVTARALRTAALREGEGRYPLRARLE